MPLPGSVTSSESKCSRGPQGILYGGANVGGAVKWVLNRPDPAEFSGRVRLSAGEDDYYDGELELNVPLAESWAARLFYFSESDDSYLENPNSVRLNGERNNNDRDVGKIRRFGARASIAGDLTERLSLYASLRYNESSGPMNHWSREINGNLRYTDEIDTSRNNKLDRETWGWSVELRYDFDAFMLTSITSNTDTDFEGGMDLDITQEYVIDGFFDIRFDVFTQELRLTSSGSGPFQWQLGGYYQDWDRAGHGGVLFYGGFGLLFEDPPRIPTPEEEQLVVFTGCLRRQRRTRKYRRLRERQLSLERPGVLSRRPRRHLGGQGEGQCQWRGREAEGDGDPVPRLRVVVLR